MIQSFKGCTPVIGEGTYVSESATIIGDVTIGKNCYVGPGAVIRADFGKITIGDFVAVEDLVVIHTSPKNEAVIKDHVILGHGALIHSIKIGSNVLIGMGAVLSIDCTVEDGSIVCEGAVVKSKQVVEKETMVGGTPAEYIKPVDEKHIAKTHGMSEFYGQLAGMYLSEQN